VGAVVFGPGRIGCGLVGLALRSDGHEVTFVGRDPNLVAHLRRVGGYHPGRRLGRLLVERLPDRSVLGSVSFASALAHPVVSRRVGDVCGDQPLTFIGDLPAGVDVDGSAPAGPPPAEPGLLVSDDDPNSVRRNVFVFGAGHAAAAYLGARKGYHFVPTAVRDPEIRREVLAALHEGCAAHVPTDCPAWRPATVLLHRYDNATRDDTVTPVGREPLRTLGADQRIVGPAPAAAEIGIRPRALTLTAAAALVAAVPTRDPSQTLELLRRVCRLSPRRGLGHQVWQCWTRLADGGGGQAALFTLSRPTRAGRPASPVPLRRRLA
jgi:mannitol dehydrogenase-like protein